MRYLFIAWVLTSQPPSCPEKYSPYLKIWYLWMDSYLLLFRAELKHMQYRISNRNIIFFCSILYQISFKPFWKCHTISACFADLWCTFSKLSQHDKQNKHKWLPCLWLFQYLWRILYFSFSSFFSIKQGKYGSTWSPRSYRILSIRLKKLTI